MDFSQNSGDHLDNEKDNEKFLSSLPKVKGMLPPGLTLYKGFWYPSNILPNVISFQTHFQSHAGDIILASQPKSGTTWLKSLIFSVVRRSQSGPPSSSPLLSATPHQLVPFFEYNLYAQNQRLPDLSSSPTPRLFSTHVPYQALPESVRDCPGGKIVYACRNPLDVMVSCWFFLSQANGADTETTMEEYFEKFSDGVAAWGPFWDHALGYWIASLERPNQVLFLKYEELKQGIGLQLKRVAEFLGVPFSAEEEREGVIEQICELCSFKNLKELEVNKTGNVFPAFGNKSYFRKGEIGDWANHVSPSMVERLQKVLEEKLADSGLNFSFKREA